MTFTRTRFETKARELEELVTDQTLPTLAGSTRYYGGWGNWTASSRARVSARAVYSVPGGLACGF